MAYITPNLKNQLIIDDKNYKQLIRVPGKKYGYAIRDYGAAPLGSFADVFPQSLYIPSSEWADRIEELDRRKAQCKDHKIKSGFKSLDQGQTNFCVDDKTEVLTEKGWKYYSDYNWSDKLATMNVDTGMMEFQMPTHQHIYEHDGEMVYSTNRRIDFGVTPDHRMLVRKWNERKRTLDDKLSFQRAGDLGWYFGLPHSTSGHYGIDLVEISVEGDRSYDGDDFLAMLSLVISDGYVGGTEKNKNEVSFACFAEHRYDMVAALAHRCGFKERPSRKGVWCKNNGSLANWIRYNCYHSKELGSQNKCVPNIVKCASSRQIRHFLTMFGDQSHKSKQTQYFSTSEKLIDDLQELLLRVGKRGSIWKADPRPISVLENGQVIHPRLSIYHLHEAEIDRLSIYRKKHLESDHYKGLVYCATVPNGTLITRRNKSILISGNCWINAVIQGMHYVRSMQGLPHVPLSPASVGSKIKNFRNVGGWGSEGLDYCVKYGAVPQSMWPANAIDRRYDTKENNEIRSKYRVEEFYELPDRSFHALVSCLLRGWPVPIGLNWWGHEILACKVVIRGSDPESDTCIDIDNSWGEDWGDNGHAILTRSKATPDEAVAVRVMSPSI